MRYLKFIRKSYEFYKWKSILSGLFIFIVLIQLNQNRKIVFELIRNQEKNKQEFDFWKVTFPDKNNEFYISEARMINEKLNNNNVPVSFCVMKTDNLDRFSLSMGTSPYIVKYCDENFQNTVLITSRNYNLITDKKIIFSGKVLKGYY